MPTDVYERLDRREVFIGVVDVHVVNRLVTASHQCHVLHYGIRWGTENTHVTIDLSDIEVSLLVHSLAPLARSFPNCIGV